MKKLKKNTLALLLLAVSIVTLMQHVYSQESESTRYDSNYIRSYPEKLGIRLFATQKYASFNLPEAVNGHDLDYHSNPKLSVGIGGGYKNIALSLALGVGYLDDKDIGKTKGLDFRFNFTPYKWQIDLITSFNKGNYLPPLGYLSQAPGKYYFRPDIKVSLVGLGVYRLINARKFSANAAASQVYWQTRSAGTLLYGGEAYYGTLKGDSALIPANATADINLRSINKITFLNIGPGIGYAYTLVLAQHYFISGSVIGNVNLSLTAERAIEKDTKTGIGASAVYKGGVGYNSATWSLSANVTGNLLTASHVNTPKNYVYNNGLFRISLAKKFDIKKDK